MISIGLGGWGTDQALEVLQVEGVKYSPDIVVYQFCGNDVTDNIYPNEHAAHFFVHWQKPFKYKLVNSTLKKTDIAPNQIPIAVRIRRKLLGSAVVYNINKVRHAVISFQNKKQKKASHPINPLGRYYPYAADSETKALKKAWQLLEALLITMKQVSQQHGAQFIVFSEESDQGKRQWNIKQRRFQTDGGADLVIWDGKTYPVDWRRPLKNLEEICQKNKIPLIKPVREYNRYERDSHANKVGNLRMAQDIVDFLINWEPFHELMSKN